MSACLYDLTLNATYDDTFGSDTLTFNGTTTNSVLRLAGSLVCAGTPSLVGSLSVTPDQNLSLTP